MVGAVTSPVLKGLWEGTGFLGSYESWRGEEGAATEGGDCRRRASVGRELT